MHENNRENIVVIDAVHFEPRLEVRLTGGPSSKFPSLPRLEDFITRNFFQEDLRLVRSSFLLRKTDPSGRSDRLRALVNDADDTIAAFAAQCRDHAIDWAAAQGWEDPHDVWDPSWVPVVVEEDAPPQQ